MQAVDTEVCVIKRQSMDRRCEVLMRMHAYAGCGDVPLSWDTLRKRLADAVREYGFLTAALADMKALGVEGYPSGLLSECGGCWTAAQSEEVCVIQSECPLYTLWLSSSRIFNVWGMTEACCIMFTGRRQRIAFLVRGLLLQAEPPEDSGRRQQCMGGRYKGATQRSLLHQRPGRH